MLKKIIVSVTGFAFLLLIAPTVLPKSVHIARSVEINASAGKVHAYIADLNQYSGWSPFQEQDPSQKTQIQGSGVGSFLTWQGERTGEGKMTITALQPSHSVTLKMDFYTPMKGEGVSIWKTESRGEEATRMTWIFEQDLPYFQRFFGLMMNAMLGDHFEKGLTNLKRRLESSS